MQGRGDGRSRRGLLAVLAVLAVVSEEGVIGAGRGYRDLIAWQKARQLVRVVYAVTRTWPREELFGLTGQVRRAAVSIPSNIAEGKGRTGRAEFLYHLSVAHGSLCEVETQLFIAHDLEYMDEQSLNNVMDQDGELGRILRALMHRVRAA